MNKQPEALRLAAELDVPVFDRWTSRDREVAAELRRQHALIEEMRVALWALIDGSQQCGELQWCGDEAYSPWNQARAVLTKAEAQS